MSDLRAKESFLVTQMMTAHTLDTEEDDLKCINLNTGEVYAAELERK